MGESVYLEKLTEFSFLLRQAGLTVGLQETADACAILEALGMEDRSVVRTALCAVYAKSQPEQATFCQTFDGLYQRLVAYAGDDIHGLGFPAFVKEYFVFAHFRHNGLRGYGQGVLQLMPAQGK